MKRERPPTPEEFEKLLAWLDSDRDEAGGKFNLINARLIKLFSSRGCVDAEALADEVSNRVAVRIDKVMASYDDPIRCFVGFVEHVHREYQREENKKQTLIEPQPRPSEELEREDRCLEQCLKSLFQPQRRLFVLYFQGEKRARINCRRDLAVELGLTMNALRIRAHNLRKELLQCIKMCIQENC
jgi:DNA-directed RNA polymerase specialized sigma24 family protein